MKKVYLYRDVPIGYGPQIFALYEDVEQLRPILDGLSTWGGTDKDTGKAKRWEFPSADGGKRFERALLACAAAGFQCEDASAENADEFWL